jgi:hypothetical protein
MFRKPFFLMLLMTAFIAVACSSGKSSPTLPGQFDLTGGQAQNSTTGSSKAMWGVWEIDIDTSTWEVTAIPLRGTQYTVDVVTFLQKPVGSAANLAITIKDITQWLTDGLIQVDVGLKHPFPGLDQYTGFDVMGVFITPGSIQGNYDSDVVYTNGIDEPILNNPDGYTRWMNPIEFPANGTILRFVPGKAGTPDLAPFNSTINAYKYFADGLDPAMSAPEFFAESANVENRGLFKPGSFNHRDYQLQFPMVGGSPKLIFQYAVVANWVEPDKTESGDPDTLDIPGDFPLSANANEAILMTIASNNSSIFFKDGVGGGNIQLGLEVFDWGAFQSSTNVSDQVFQIVVEGDSSVIPGGHVVFDQTTLKATAAPGSSEISSVFQVEIDGCTPSNNNPLPILITVENTNPATFDPGTGTPGNDDRLAGYSRIVLPVGEAPSDFKVTSPDGGETLWMSLYHNITWNTGSGGITNVMIEWSTDDFVSDIQTIVASTPNNGSYIWKPIPNVDTTTARIRVSDVLGAASDTSDNTFTIALPVWLDFQNEVDVSNSTVGFSTVPYDKYYDEFSCTLAQNAAGQGHIVWHSLINANAKETVIRSNDGDAWTGEGGCFFTSGGDTSIRDDRMKLATTPSSVFVMVNHWQIYFSVDVDHFIHGHGEYNYPNNMLNDGPHIVLNGEIMADDTYLYEVGDKGAYYQGDGPGIYSIRVEDPGPAFGWHWPMYEPMVNITNFGEVSHVRSWCPYNGTIALAYFTPDNKIRISKQTDQTGNTWDDTEIIFDGAANGYTSSRNPSISSDPDGRLFALWVAKETASNEWHLLASMKETPTSSWSTPIIADTSANEINDAHISVSKNTVALPTGDDEYVVLTGYEKDGVTMSAISPMDMWAFLPAVQVSADGDITRDPDTLCMADPYTYDALIVWSYEVTPGALGVGNYDIKFRNGDFKTP